MWLLYPSIASSSGEALMLIVIVVDGSTKNTEIIFFLIMPSTLYKMSSVKSRSQIDAPLPPTDPLLPFLQYLIEDS